MGTGIHWTDETWNPVSGCSRVSDGCRNCYAEKLSLRYGWSKKPWTAANAAENVVLHPDRLDKPKHWRRPRMVFVNSMSDLFHERVPSSFINDVWATMFNVKRHTYQILTKRPERLLEWTLGKARATGWPPEEVWPSWVWLGVSVEAQREADLRIPLLLQTPTSGVRFLSCEPLLAPVDLAPYVGAQWYAEPKTRHGQTYDVARVRRGVDWVIVGGESGAHYRPMEVDWARALRDQCTAAEVAFFYKQSSGMRPGMNRTLDGRMWEEMPTAREVAVS